MILTLCAIIVNFCLGMTYANYKCVKGHNTKDSKYTVKVKRLLIQTAICALVVNIVNISLVVIK